VTGVPPRVEVEVHSITLESTRSVAVELCLFRLCDWQSLDVRASTRDERDDAYREHLRREHAEQIERLVGLIP